MADGQKDTGRRDEAENAIERRLIDEGQTDREDVLGAAADEFVEDQKDPNHPSRKEREFGVEDPTHSKGSQARDLTPGK